MDEVNDAPEEVKEELSRCVKSDDLVDLFMVLDTDGGGSIDVEEFIEGLTNIVTSGITVKEMKRRKQLNTCTEKILDINKKVDLVQENLEERVKALDEKIDASR